MSSENKPPKLGTRSGDLIAMVGKSSFGLIPGVGPALSELINQFIPNQRADRVEQYLKYLDAKLASLTEDERQKRLLNEDAAYLVEEGGFQSARATSDERRERLSSIVAHGITGDERDRIEAKRLLWLIQQIDDDQTIILSSYLQRLRMDSSFREKHKAILHRLYPTVNDGQNERDTAALQRLAEDQLVSLGLLEHRYRWIKNGDLPEFDHQTGKMKSSHTDLTPLAHLFLRRIGLAADGEF